MQFEPRPYVLVPCLSLALLAIGGACEDSSTNSSVDLPDAAPVAFDASPGFDARGTVVEDAAPDASPDAPVIVGCVPQEISTRYDAVWLFGSGCRADWNSSNQVTFTADGVPFQGFEGTITAANPYTGALFAASDGIDLYAEDGGKTNTDPLGANTSAAQPVAFTGKPGSAADFYVVTNGSADGSESGGLYFSTLECGSAVPAGPPTLISGTEQFTEALMTVRHANNTNRWLLGVAPTGIAVIPVTAAGFGAPVITDFGGTLLGIVAHQRAFIAFARDRATFAITAENRGLVTGHFDNATGTITALKALPVLSTGTLYSAAFSPDGTKLYASQWYGAFWQIDLTAGPDAGVSTSLGTSYGALRVAIDGKIYLAQSGAQTLTVINNPNAPAASLSIDTVTLPTGCTSTYGLPGVGDL